ncbi:hypothetical protein [Bacillus thuringiensis]|nr:hypothetical protein [Bacillus thuringiensis]MDY8165899.1 hypothetical protein [Bacillus thuringiensis]MED3580378.1 hypothetical protein [Bacillus thuringiensis]HDR5274830.1 hypothetical protein [Bacillus thuringiensis]
MNSKVRSVNKDRKKKKQSKKREHLTLHDIKYLMGSYNPRCNGKTFNVIK